MYDVICALSFGLIGLLFKKVNIPQAPVFLGIILEPIIEKNLVTAYTLAKAEYLNILVYTFKRPLCMGIFILGMLLVYTNLLSSKREAQMKKEISRG